MSNDRIEGFALSPQQRDLWRLQQRDGAAAYRSRVMVRITGPLDVPRLRRALSMVVERNEILRPAFHRLPGMDAPLMSARSIAPELREVDLSASLPLGRSARLERLWAGEVDATCDGEQAAALEAVVATTAPDESFLLLSLPALCADAVALNLLVADVRACYTHQTDAREDAQESLQYIDLAEWQNGILESPDGQAGRDFWRRQMPRSSTRAVLPFEQPRESRQFTIGSVPVPLEHGDPQPAIRERLLLAWALLLGRITGLAEVPLGIVCEGRNYDALATVHGLFARCVPLSLPAVDRVSLRDAAGVLDRAVAEAAEWQQCFSWEQLQARGEEGPFLPYVFEAREQAFAAPAEPGTPAFSVERRSAVIARFHLSLVCEVTESGCVATVLHDSSRCASADIRVVADQLGALIASMRAAPESVCGQLSALGREERRALTLELNDTRRDFADEPCVHEMFAHWATRRPDAVALVCEDAHMTFRALDARANRIARRLRRMGAQPEATVAVCLERSADTIVGLLAVLKSGAAYVPLDPLLPQVRLAHVIADSAPVVLLTNAKLLGVLPAGLPSTLLLDDRGVETERSDMLPAGATAGHLAYVLHTSGSTGRPKGVAVEHRQLRNYVLGLLERVDASPGDVWATASTIAADLGNTSIFGALCGGGCLHVIASDRISDPDGFAEAMRHHPVDVLKLVPSHLQALLQGTSPADVLPLHTLIVGGESCRHDLVDRVRQLAPACRVINHYGPTETTVGVLTAVAPQTHPLPGAGALTLDRPLANSRVYLLDADMQPVPRWAEGEIYVAGDGLARGYLNRPAHTAERFVPDSFAGEPGGRLYRTGDLARHLSAGAGLEIRGRVDDQVKIRGFRVELGEIASVLRDHPSVADALAIARAGDDDGRLVAYVVLRPNADTPPAALRGYLASRLPDYMVPVAIVVLPAIPLTSNGKIDRAALPPLSSGREAGAGPHGRGPRGPIEEVVAAACAEVLKLEVEDLGARDNLFDRGCHSLLVAQVVARIREYLGVALRLREFFEDPTVAGLAARVEAARGGQQRIAPPFARVVGGGPLPTSFAQQRLWFHDQLQPGSSFYNIFHAVVMDGRLDVEALRAAVGEIVRRHDGLRTTFTTLDGLPAQMVGTTRPQPLPWIDLTRLDEAARDREAARLVTAESRRPFDLRRGPLLRVSLVRLAHDRYIGLFTMHHIVSDAWSMSLLVHELGQLYEAFRGGTSSPLPELPFQYGDFAAWQRGWLTGDTEATEVAWWRDRLAGMLPAFDVPTDRPRLAVQSLRGEAVMVTLPAALSGSLRALSRRQGTTMFMTCLAAFNVQLFHLSGCSDVVVGTNVANRDRLETERLIGFFVNQVVLRTAMSDGATFSELLAGVRSVVLDAMDHQHVPFDRLVDALRPPRDRSRSLLYQVKIELHPDDRELPRIGPVAVESYPFLEPPARYDLHLTLAAAGPEIRARLVYDAALFDAATALHWLVDFRRLLETVVADSDVRIAALRDLLARSAAERRRRSDEAYSAALRHTLPLPSRRVSHNVALTP